MSQSASERGMDISLKAKCTLTLWPSYPGNAWLPKVMYVRFAAACFIAAKISDKPGYTSTEGMGG